MLKFLSVAAGRRAMARGWALLSLGFLLATLLATPLANIPEPIPCLPGPQACTPCHAQDLETRWARGRGRPCTSYCQGCHRPSDLKSHHPVALQLRRPPRDPALLAPEGRLGCTTCHDLGRPRRDSVSWRSQSLFDRTFRRKASHPTYYLALRNDRGQLCRACH